MWSEPELRLLEPETEPEPEPEPEPCLAAWFPLTRSRSRLLASSRLLRNVSCLVSTTFQSSFPFPLSMLQTLSTA